MSRSHNFDKRKLRKHKRIDVGSCLFSINPRSKVQLDQDTPVHDKKPATELPPTKTLHTTKPHCDKPSYDKSWSHNSICLIYSHNLLLKWIQLIICANQILGRFLRVGRKLLYNATLSVLSYVPCTLTLEVTAFLPYSWNKLPPSLHVLYQSRPL